MTHLGWIGRSLLFVGMAVLLAPRSGVAAWEPTKPVEFIIPAGTGHQFTRIDDHIDYLMVRIDPDKVTPIKDAAASRAYLSRPAPKDSRSSGI